MKGGVGKYIEETIRSLCEWKSIDILALNVREVLRCGKHTAEALDFGSSGHAKEQDGDKVFKSFPALKRKPYWGNHFWSRGSCVTTVGLDEYDVASWEGESIMQLASGVLVYRKPFRPSSSCSKGVR